jgi:hypothetical protein
MGTAQHVSSIGVVLVALFSTPSFADSADVRFRIGDIFIGVDIGPPPAPIVEYVPGCRAGPCLGARLLGCERPSPRLESGGMDEGAARLQPCRRALEAARRSLVPGTAALGSAYIRAPRL